MIGSRIQTGSFSFAVLAQLAEHLICNQQVVGSTPAGGFRPEMAGVQSPLCGCRIFPLVFPAADFGSLAQSGERLPHKQLVAGSNPAGSMGL